MSIPITLSEEEKSRKKCYFSFFSFVTGLAFVALKAGSHELCSRAGPWKWFVCTSLNTQYSSRLFIHKIVKECKMGLR